MSLLPPSDEFFDRQWYLESINVIQTELVLLGPFPFILATYSVWDDYTGAGVKVGVFDGGMELTHPDLTDQIDASLNFGPQSGDAVYHGTAVGSIIAAEKDTTGMIGIAHNATISSVQTIKLPAGEDDTDYAMSANYLMRNFDVVNQSIGSPVFVRKQDSQRYLIVLNAMEDAAVFGRGGLGTVFTSSAGNSRYTEIKNGEEVLASDANVKGAPAGSRYAIVVAATNQDGTITDFSTPGANVFVSAPGEGIFIADQQGALGDNDAPGVDGNYQTSNGTSYSAPMVAGVAALLLEANPNLGHRDVKDIIALSARHTGTSIAGPFTQGDEFYLWQINSADNWNGGGMHFSNDYGFGMLDARAAVALAETWNEQDTSANEAHISSSRQFERVAQFPWEISRPPLFIPDDDPDGIIFTFDIGPGIDIEQVQIYIGVEHTYVGDLEIWLTSPSGTRTKLLDNVGRDNEINGWSFVANAFRGEQSQGTWSVQVIDSDAGVAGFIRDARLDIYGSASSENDTYYFTDEFGLLALAIDPSRSLLQDAEGVDTINAAAITHDTALDLRNGGVSTIAFRDLTIEGTIENAFTGYGNDTLFGNEVANKLDGRRGNDTIAGGGENDTIHGDAGADSLSGEAGNDVLDGGKDNDVLQGNEGDDHLLGGIGDDQLQGGIGNDLLDGESDNDALQGDEDEDQLFGGLGNDILEGGSGNDSLQGGREAAATRLLYDGDDTLNGGQGNDQIFVGTGFDSVDGGDDEDTLVFDGLTPVTADMSLGEASFTRYYTILGLGGLEFHAELSRTTFINIENLQGSNASDALKGDQNANRILGHDGHDEIAGDGGNDTLGGGYLTEAQSLGTDGNDTIAGNEGNDLIVASFGDDQADGGEGIDTLTFEWADGDVTANLLTGLAGWTESGFLEAQFEFVNWITQNTVLISTIENLLGGSGKDAFTGDGQDNLFTALGGNDTLSGGDGNDTLNGGYNSEAAARGMDGNDSLDGGQGNDLIVASFGNDTVAGGQGIDTLSFEWAGGDVNASLTGGSTSWLESGSIVSDNEIASWIAQNSVEFSGIENMRGGSGNDTLAGDGLSNRLIGNAGNDSLVGDGGADSLDGGAGNDRMAGGLGNDQYFVDSVGDTVIEQSNGGIDTINTTRTTYVLPVNVERVIYYGAAAFVGIGNSGNNRFSGNTSHDRFVDVLGGNDTFSGGNGSDSVDFRSSSTGVVINLSTGSHGGAAAGDTFASIEKFFGSNVDGDVMIGGAGRANFSGFGGNDTLTGGNNLDTLQGNAGDDVLSGLGGADLIDGGAGNDTMAGGSGKDYFIYSAAGFGVDVITNYEDGLDKFKVHSSIANNIAAFNITGNGTTNVVLTQISSPTNAISLQSASAITITAADFLFY